MLMMIRDDDYDKNSMTINSDIYPQSPQLVFSLIDDDYDNNEYIYPQSSQLDSLISLRNVNINFPRKYGQCQLNEMPCVPGQPISFEIECKSYKAIQPPAYLMMSFLYRS